MPDLRRRPARRSPGRSLLAALALGLGASCDGRTLLAVTINGLPGATAQLRVQGRTTSHYNDPIYCSSFDCKSLWELYVNKDVQKFGIWIPAELTYSHYIAVDALDADGCTLSREAWEQDFSTAERVEFPIDLRKNQSPVARCLLSINLSGDGSVVPAAGAGCIYPCSPAEGEYAKGSSVQLLAEPGQNAVFTSWAIACQGSNPMCTVLLSGPKTVSAIFSYKTGL